MHNSTYHKSQNIILSLETGLDLISMSGALLSLFLDALYCLFVCVCVNVCVLVFLCVYERGFERQPADCY